MWNPQRLGNPAGIVDIPARTAGRASRHHLAVIIKLQGDTDNLVALAFEQGSNDRRIDAARHGDDDAGFLRATRKAQAVQFCHGDGDYRNLFDSTPTGVARVVCRRT